MSAVTEKIRTAYVDLRNARDHSCDWSATSENYEADWQGDEVGFVGSHPIGFGATEVEAIADYKAQVEDER